MTHVIGISENVILHFSPMNKRECGYLIDRLVFKKPFTETFRNCIRDFSTATVQKPYHAVYYRSNYLFSTVVRYG
jgi:hypothetical protein